MAGIFELKQISACKFHFVLKAANGEIILSSQSYRARPSRGRHRLGASQRPRRRAPRRKTSKRGEPYFVLKAANGEIIGSSEMYTAEAGMETGIASVKKHAPGARLKDITEAKAAPKTAAPKKAATKKATPEKAATKKAAPKKAATKKAAPKKAAPGTKRPEAPKELTLRAREAWMG